MTRLCRKYYSEALDFDDLLQEARIALVEAERDFDPQRSTNFLTYLAHRISSRLQKFSRANTEIVSISARVAIFNMLIGQMEAILQQFGLSETEIKEAISCPPENNTPAVQKLTPQARNSFNKRKQLLARHAARTRTSYEKAICCGYTAKVRMRGGETLFWGEADQEQVENNAYVSEIPPGGEDKTTPKQELHFTLKQLKDCIKKILPLKQYVALSLHVQGYNYREISRELLLLGLDEKERTRQNAYLLVKKAKQKIFKYKAKTDDTDA